MIVVWACPRLKSRRGPAFRCTPRTDYRAAGCRSNPSREMRDPGSNHRGTMNTLTRFLSWFKVEAKPTAIEKPDPRYEGPAFQTDGVTSIYFHEDDYCQVQLLPKEDQDHLSAEEAKVREVAEKNFTGYGFSNIHVPTKEPISLSSRRINTAEIDNMLLAQRFKRITTVFSGSMSDRAVAQETLAFKCGSYVLYYDQDNGTVRSIWLDLFGKASSANRADLINALHLIGTRWNLVLMHWSWSSLVDLSAKHSIEEYFDSYTR